MSEETIKSILKTVHVSGIAVTGILAVGLGFIVYKNYFEVKKLKLDIARLNQLLAAPVWPNK